MLGKVSLSWFSNQGVCNSMELTGDSVPDNTLAKKDKDDVNYRLKAGIFLTSVTAVSALVAFGMTLAAAKKKDPVMFEKGSRITRDLQETGVELAMRALKWGTFYAVSGCSLVAYGVWTLSGATNLEEFRYKMGSILPQIKKNNPPIGRTEFSGMNDLLNYVSEEYQKDTAQHNSR
ncbi:transmembrane protein 242 [Halyomorpha halys]|uniref:transmembrane protein 242 n=1 Tax=Halyomorpha halys TaxID=286706 RepID=UPI0006D4C6DD|nr:transmembrane protein 242 [Halyomorpha halys]